ncbi:MAG: hypothetical protein DIU78_016170 [Pseudomonadota bacterium]|nr:MAG: hypothetical protein DIU78_04105 [Pseudomonadota bacterium]
MSSTIERALGAPSVPSASTPLRSGPLREAGDGSGFASVLRTLGERLDSGEALVDRALRGNFGSLDAGALIAVQAGIYRYAEAVDLAAKLVDRTGTAVRTVLQSGST